MSFRDIEDNWLHKQSGEARASSQSRRLQSVEHESFNALAKKLTQLESFTNTLLAAVKHNSVSGRARRSSSSHANARESQSLQSLILQAGECARETKRLFDLFLQDTDTSEVRLQRQVAKLRKDFKRQKAALEEAVELALEKEKKRQRTELREAEEQRERELQVERQLVSAAVSVQAEDLLAREEEIEKLHVTAAQVGGLFKELAVMVDEQQEDVDRIDVAVHSAHEQTDRGLAQLDKATRRLKMVNKRTLYCFLLLLVAAVIAIAVLANKH